MKDFQVSAAIEFVLYTLKKGKKIKSLTDFDSYVQ